MMDFAKMSISELAWELVPIYAEKAEAKKLSDIEGEHRLVKASEVSQKDFLIVEKILHEYFDEMEFVELAPLQPLGINCVLANTNGKKLIPTIRGQEVNSDATTALLLEIYRRNGFESDSRLATNVRVTRPKVFSAESRFLSHFKVFAEVSVGRQTAPYGKNEVDTIAKHLFDELNVLCEIRHRLKNSIKTFKVAISDLYLIGSQLAASVSPAIHKVHATKEAWEKSGLPASLPFDEHLVYNLRQLGFKKGLKILEMFLDSFLPLALHNESVSYCFDLSRSAGADYYKHIAYGITAISENGTELPLVDGGSNDWGSKITFDKQIYTVSSGIGTELLIKYFLRPTS